MKKKSTIRKPRAGSKFKCPICQKTVKVSANTVVLNQEVSTGIKRGYICKNCNIGLKKLGDDICILANAIIWIHKGGA